MAKAEFDPGKALGAKIAQMDKQELCTFVSALCRAVVAEVGSRGRRGGLYPDNISVGADGAIAIGPAGKAPWQGQELQFVAPELYWNGQLSAASDVYSIGLMMYCAVSGGKLPLEGECEDPQLRRMGGGNPKAPKSAGRRLGTIIEKSLRFKASERYQTLEELRAVVDSCVKNLYLRGVPSAEAIFKKSDDDLDEVERMMVGIIERDEDTAIETAEDFPEEEPEDGVKVYKPAAKGERKDVLSASQAELLARKMKSTSSPAVPKLGAADEDLAPVTLAKGAVRSSPAVQYKLKSDRERQIQEEIRKRRRRPLAVILVLCGLLLLAAVVFNAIPNISGTSRRGAAVSAPPTEAPSPTLTPIPFEAFNSATPGPSITMEPVVVPEVELPPANEHGYQVLVDDGSWTDAQRKCAALGGHLVAIDDEEELQEVIRMAEEAGISRVWIGMHRTSRDSDTYAWDGKNADYAGFVRWARGEPTFEDEGFMEDFIMLWDHNGWAYNDNRDDPCRDYPDFYSGTMGYICEFYD